MMIFEALQLTYSRQASFRESSRIFFSRLEASKSSSDGLSPSFSPSSAVEDEDLVNDSHDCYNLCSHIVPHNVQEELSVNFLSKYSC